MKDEIIAIITKAANDLNPTFPSPINIKEGNDAKLYGQGGPLDSLALVRLIVEVEAGVEDKFGGSITLASDRAMSQKRSPFLTIGFLAAYIEEVLTEAAGSESN